MSDEICVLCGERNPRGMFCYMSNDGEGYHQVERVNTVKFPSDSNGRFYDDGR